MQSLAQNVSGLPTAPPVRDTTACQAHWFGKKNPFWSHKFIKEGCKSSRKSMRKFVAKWGQNGAKIAELLQRTPNCAKELRTEPKNAKRAEERLNEAKSAITR